MAEQIKTIRVRAKAVKGQEYSCYYNLVLRKPGDVFDIFDEVHFSDICMERVEPTTPKTPVSGEPSIADLIADGQISESGKNDAKRKRV